MIVIRVGMNVHQEKQLEFTQTLLSIIEPAGKEAGCLSYNVFCDIEDDCAFSVLAEWETREALNHHLRSQRFGVLLGTKTLLCESPKIQIHTVSGSEGIEAVDAARSRRS
jgi:quinol monooxygenase YgiN